MTQAWSASTLSRWRHGFESRWGCDVFPGEHHFLPHVQSFFTFQIDPKLASEAPTTASKWTRKPFECTRNAVSDES